MSLLLPPGTTRGFACPSASGCSFCRALTL
jgi:hypothetical protein